MIHFKTAFRRGMFYLDASTKVFYVFGVYKMRGINSGYAIIPSLIIRCYYVMNNVGKFSINRSTVLNLEGFSLSPVCLDNKILPGDHVNCRTSSVPDWSTESPKKDFHLQLPQRFKSYAYIFMFQQTFRIYRQIHSYIFTPVCLSPWKPGITWRIFVKVCMKITPLYGSLPL